MKRIAYTRPDGAVSIVSPAPMARHVKSIIVGGEKISVEPTRFDVFVTQYGTQDLSPEWAETESEFLERVRVGAVPDDAVDVAIVDEIPEDRSTRASWALVDGKVVAR